MARASIVGAEDPRVDDEDARSDAEPNPAEIAYSKLPRTSLAPEEGRRESFHVCAPEGLGDHDSGR